MNEAFNNCFFLGLICSQLRVKKSKTGELMCKFAICNVSRDKDKKPSYFSCMAFGEVAEFVSTKCYLGSRVIVTAVAESFPVYNNHNGKVICYGVSFKVKDVQLIYRNKVESAQLKELGVPSKEELDTMFGEGTDLSDPDQDL